MKKQIVIAQRGWVLIGDVSPTEDHFTISNCSVIRRWGTERGLGQLADSGPTESTVLDKCPPVFIHKLSVVARMDVTYQGTW